MPLLAAKAMTSFSRSSSRLSATYQEVAAAAGGVEDAELRDLVGEVEQQALEGLPLAGAGCADGSFAIGNQRAGLALDADG